jgi:hypothetical protein
MVNAPWQNPPAVHNFTKSIMRQRIILQTRERGGMDSECPWIQVSNHLHQMVIWYIEPSHPLNRHLKVSRFDLWPTTMCWWHGVSWISLATDLVSIVQAMQQPDRLQNGGSRYKVHSSILISALQSSTEPSLHLDYSLVDIKTYFIELR